MLNALASNTLSRRDCLRLALMGVGVSSSGWLNVLAEESRTAPARRSCIVLWMGGGPSQIDTFDLKPGEVNGGPFKEIQTSSPGLKISEHLPKLSKWGHRLAVIRSMTTKEGDHSRATRFMHTGYSAQGPIQFPPIGSSIAKELAHPDAALPSCISIAPNRNVQLGLVGGFLGPQFAPLAIGGGNQITDDTGDKLQIADLHPPATVISKQIDARLTMLAHLDRGFLRRLGGDDSFHPSALAALGHCSAYQRAEQLMRTKAGEAFDLNQEPEKLRETYGRNVFGQGCLLARRLVERGVPFVEVNLSHIGDNNNAWDTHQQNFDRVQQLCDLLDPAWSALLQDLSDRSLLDSTTIVWMGEFGRSPIINNNSGRDHFPAAWTTVLAGGGIRGGQAIGRTTKDGMRVADRPVTGPDLIATICRAIGLDPQKQNLSNVGRPIRIADPDAKVVEEALL